MARKTDEAQSCLKRVNDSLEYELAQARWCLAAVAKGGAVARKMRADIVDVLMSTWLTHEKCAHVSEWGGVRLVSKPQAGF